MAQSASLIILLSPMLSTVPASHSLQISSRMAKRLPALASQLGVDGKALCQRHAIDLHALEDRHARLPLEPVLSGLEELQKLKPQATLGLLMASAAPPDVYHTPGLVLMASDCLHQGFRRAFELQRLWGDGERFSLTSSVDLGLREPGLSVCFRIPSPRRNGHEILEICALAETMIAARALTGRSQERALALTLPSLSHGLQEISEFFGVRPSVGADSACIVLTDELVELPLLHANTMFRQVFERQAKEELAEFPRADDFLDLAQSEILRGLARGKGALADCAKALGLSTRTLERRLSERGTTYQNLLDQARKARALRLIQAGLSLDEVSALLGYSERSSFHRACVRWFSRTPAQLRNGEPPC